jgi:hypothetical protein
MSKRRASPDPDRRKFLKGATLAGAAALTPVAAEAQVKAGASGPVAAAKAAGPGPIQNAIRSTRRRAAATSWSTSSRSSTSTISR